MTPDLKIRIEVLKTALMLEELTSALLANLLGVTNIKGSISFSDKSSALSFNQKVNLLIDMCALDRSTRSKFQVFMEIRNQFMHNAKATTYELCFSFTDNKGVFVLNNYPQNKKLTKEEQLKLAVSDLSGEILALTLSVINKIKIKIKNEVTAEAHKQTLDDLQKSIAEATKLLDNYIDNEIKKGTNFTVKKLKGIGTDVSKLIYQLTIKKTKAR